MLEEERSDTLLKMIQFNKKLLSEQLFLEHSQHTVPSSAPKKYCSYLAYFPAQTQKKTKNIDSEKNSLYYRKWNFLAQILKKFLYFLKRKLFWYFQKWNPAVFSRSLKNKRNHVRKRKGSFHIFQEMELLSPQLNKFLIFQEGTCKV